MSNDRLRPQRATTFPNSAPPSVSKNQPHSTFHGPRLTPDVVARLQREAGNHAVSSKLAVQRGGGAPVQAAPMATEGGPTSEEALKVFNALDSILRVEPARADWVDARDGLLSYATGFQGAFTEAARWAQATVFAETVPSKHMHVLHLWYAAARNMTFVELGPPRPLRGPALLEHIHRARTATEPFVTALRPKEYAHTEWYLKTRYFNHVDKIMDRAHRETAAAAVKAGAERNNYLLPPEQIQQEKQATRAIAEAITVMSWVAGQVNNSTGSELDDAFKGILAENPPPGPVGDKLTGMKVAVAVSHVSEVLGALKAIADLTDPEQKKKLFDKSMGPWGYIENSTSLMANFLRILQGTASGVTGLTVAVASVLGHAFEAAKLLAHSRKITQGLGNAIAALSIANGVATLLNDKSTDTDKVHGFANISTGVGTLTSATRFARFSPYALAVEPALRLGWWGLKSNYEMKKQAKDYDLRQAINTINSQGIKLADRGNRVAAASKLLTEETDPIRKQYLVQEYEQWVHLLRDELDSIVTRNTTERKNVAEPGYWEELRARFEGIGPAPGKSAPVDSMMDQARTSLEIMSRVFEDYEEILQAQILESY